MLQAPQFAQGCGQSASPAEWNPAPQEPAHWQLPPSWAHDSALPPPLPDAAPLPPLPDAPKDPPLPPELLPALPADPPLPPSSPELEQAATSIALSNAKPSRERHFMDESLDRPPGER